MTKAPERFILLLAAVLMAQTAAAQTSTTPEFRERCATRLSMVLHGKTAPSTLMTSTNPQTSVDTMLASPDFIERMSRFVNAKYNVDPGVTAAEDSSYYLAKYVLANGKPWKDMFVGGYQVNPDPANLTGNAVVVTDANGLGYFRSRTWMVRYAGNELDGYRITAGYRMMNNILGLKLQAAVNTNGVNATGRMQAACAGCHYNTTFGLDYAAKILSKRVGTNANTMTFSAPTEGAQPLLDTTITDDRNFATTMVNSMDFRFNVCRTAMEFLYGRSEFKCEGPVFDSCMTQFAAMGTMQSAVAAIAKDQSFCQ
jgi:hypothetical protein